MNPKINSYSLEDLAKHHEQTQSVVHRYVTEADMLDDRKEFVKKEFEYLKEIERLEIELKKRDEQNAALAAQVEALRKICMEDYAMYLQSGDRMLHENIPDAVAKWAEKELPNAPEHLRQVRAEAGRDGYLQGHLDAMGDPDEIDKEHAAYRAHQHKASILAGKE